MVGGRCESAVLIPWQVSTMYDLGAMLFKEGSCGAHGLADVGICPIFKSEIVSWILISL